MNSRLLLIAAAAASLCSSAVTQKMPIPGDNRLIVQLHDASEWLDLATQRPSITTREKTKVKLLADMAAFARAFVKPALQEGQDIRPLANRYLVVIAEAEQQAWLERMQQRHLKGVVYQVDFEVRQFDVSKKDYAAVVEPLEAKPVAGMSEGVGPPHTMLTSEQADRLVKALGRLKDLKLVAARRVITRAMGGANASVGKDLSYVKDFDVEIEPHKLIANPITGHIFDGLQVRATCGRLGNRKLGVALDLVFRTVEQPFGEFQTTLGVGKKVTIQLPNSAELRWQRNLIFPDLPGRDGALCSFEVGERRVVFLVRAGVAR
jgi:hypothetical protein